MMTKLALSSVKSLTVNLGLPNSSGMAKTALSFGVVMGFDTLQNTTVIQNLLEEIFSWNILNSNYQFVLISASEREMLLEPRHHS